MAAAGTRRSILRPKRFFTSSSRLVRATVVISMQAGHPGGPECAVPAHPGAFPGRLGMQPRIRRELPRLRVVADCLGARAVAEVLAARGFLGWGGPGARRSMPSS
ncbi:MAG: hypothetical protein NVSMB32_07780 [Actinomycetota bacterium]